MTLPLMASADILSSNNSDIIVHNNVSVKSTIRLTSGMGLCVGQQLWTEPGETLAVSWNSINILCYGEFPCTADVYIGDDHDCRDNAKSKDVVIGSVSLSEKGYITIKSVVSGHSLLGGQSSLTING